MFVRLLPGRPVSPGSCDLWVEHYRARAEDTVLLATPILERLGTIHSIFIFTGVPVMYPGLSPV